MLFIALFTLDGALLAAALKPLIAACACDLLGLPLVLPILAAALQNLVFAAGTDALAGTAITASADAASTAARKSRARAIVRAFRSLPYPRQVMLLSNGD